MSTSSGSPPPSAGQDAAGRPLIGARGQVLKAPVKRGQACLECRKKKVKCDAQKPHCSACVKHHALLLTTDSSSTLLCTWDPEKPAGGPSNSTASSSAGGAKKARVSEKGKRKGSDALREEESSRVEELEAKVREMEAKLGAYAAVSSAGGSRETNDSRFAVGSSSGTTGTQYLDHLFKDDPSYRSPDTVESIGRANSGTSSSYAHHQPPTPSMPGLHGIQTTSNPLGHPVQAQAAQIPPFGFAESSAAVRIDPLTSSILAGQPPYPVGRSPGRMESGGGSAMLGGEEQAYTPIFTPSEFILPEPTYFHPVSSESVPPAPQPSVPPPPAAASSSTSPSLSADAHMLHSNYPSRLPPPSMLLSLVETFFDRVPMTHKILHRGRFMRDLQAGPGTRMWPHVAVLHAICALSARYSGFLAAFEPPVKFPTVDGSTGAGGEECKTFGLQDPLDMDSFGAKHMLWAREECEKEYARAERLLDVAIAKVILTGFDFLNARWVCLWLSSAEVLRLCIPLGLHESQESVVVPGTKPGLLMGTEDAVEREARRRTFWAAFMCDRLASISSGWAQSLEEADVTLELPTSDAEFNRGTLMKENTQHLRSPNLFSSHYPDTTDSYVLAIKATILLSRVKQFNRRVLKESYANSASIEHSELKASPQFKMVQNQVELFRTTLPKEFRHPVRDAGGEVVDVDLVLAHTLTFTAAIALHEHHVNLMAFTDPSSSYVLAAARGMLSIIFLIFSTSFDVMRLPPFVAHCWYIGGRTLARFYQAAVFVRDPFAQKSIMSEIEIFRMALNLMGEKLPVAHRQAAMLDQAVQDAIHASEPMKPAFICAIVQENQGSVQSTTTTATSPPSVATASASAPSPADRRNFVFQSFADPSRNMSISSTSTDPPGSSSSTSTLPTISPFSAPGSTFSSASSPDEQFPRPSHQVPPLELDETIIPVNYPLLPDFEGADATLIKDLFGPGGTLAGMEFGSPEIITDFGGDESLSAVDLNFPMWSN